jgi:outer membrane protein OmpA-like peptidoglycan-associated protein
MTSFSFAQKGKGNEKEVFKMTFENTKDKETVTELGAVEMLEGEVLSTMEVKADLFMKDASGDVGIPNNVFGSENPKDGQGDSYAGVIAYKPGKNGNMERSYITIALKKGKETVTLKKGLKYCVSYDASLAESSKYAINNLGLYFSKSPFGAEPPKVGDTDDHLVLNPTKDRVPRRIVKGFFGWEKVGNVYVAKGDEKYISIGNFQSNQAYTSTDTPWKFESVKKPKESEVEAMNHAYYYIDNVVIRLIDKEEECECYKPVVVNLEESFSPVIYNKPIELDEKMTLSQKVEAHQVHFRGGQAKFTSNATDNLSFILEALKKDPKISIEVIGHTDVKEDEAGAQDEQYKDLDRERVKAVINYLVKNGIDASRLKASHKSSLQASSDIVEDDDADVKEAKNRRVEFKVIK